VYGRDYRALAQVEATADKQLFKQLEKDCEQQRADHKKAVSQARRATGKDQADLLEKAHNMAFPSCERVQEILANA